MESKCTRQTLSEPEDPACMEISEPGMRPSIVLLSKRRMRSRRSVWPRGDSRSSDWSRGRRRADSNRWWDFCRVLPCHLATAPWLTAPGFYHGPCGASTPAGRHRPRGGPPAGPGARLHRPAHPDRRASIRRRPEKRTDGSWCRAGTVTTEKRAWSTPRSARNPGTARCQRWSPVAAEPGGTGALARSV